MTINLFSNVALLRKQLAVAAHLLDKAEAHAAGEAFLDWRLADDMHPLRFQLMVVRNFAVQWPARVVGMDVPPDVMSTLDLAGFRAALAEAGAFLDALTPDRFAGRDDVPHRQQLTETMEPTMPLGDWLVRFALPNVFFHLSMVYAILRGRGVPLGKLDFFGGAL